jgi:hypothetical protein
LEILIMRTILVSLLTAVVSMVVGCSSGESAVRAGYDFGTLDKVAVVDVIGNVRGDAGRNQISDYFVMELLKKGYAPIERAQVQTLLKEQDFQMSELTSAEGAARAGQILNVPAVVVINVPKFGEDINMTAKLIDVEDGSILWLGSGTGSTRKTLATILGAAGGAAAGAAVAGDEKVIGGVAGAVLGGTLAHGLSPQEAEQAKKIIEKMCRTLPPRQRF